MFRETEFSKPMKVAAQFVRLAIVSASMICALMAQESAKSSYSAKIDVSPEQLLAQSAGAKLAVLQRRLHRKALQQPRSDQHRKCGPTTHAVGVPRAEFRQPGSHAGGGGWHDFRYLRERRICARRTNRASGLALFAAGYGRSDRRRLAAPQSRRGDLALAFVYGNRQRSLVVPRRALRSLVVGRGVHRRKQKLRSHQRAARCERQSAGGHVRWR